LHEDGGTEFSFAGSAGTPKWFNQKRRGPSISFWFRDRLPSVALFVASTLMDTKHLNNDSHSLTAYLRTNICEYDLDINNVDLDLVVQPDHTYLYDLRLQEMKLESVLGEALLIAEWIHAEITFKCEGCIEEALRIESGIHVFELKSSMEDIRFTNPYE